MRQMPVLEWGYSKIRGESNSMKKKAARMSPGEWFERPKRKPATAFAASVKRHRFLYALLLPDLLYITLFKYVPMAGIVIKSRVPS